MHYRGVRGGERGRTRGWPYLEAETQRTRVPRSLPPCPSPSSASCQDFSKAVGVSPSLVCRVEDLKDSRRRSVDGDSASCFSCLPPLANPRACFEHPHPLQSHCKCLKQGEGAGRSRTPSPRPVSTHCLRSLRS